MISINWHAEALDFCKRNNVCSTDTTLATVEKVMEAGALVVTIPITEMLAKVSADLNKQRADSTPHPEVGRPIPIQF